MPQLPTKETLDALDAKHRRTALVFSRQEGADGPLWAVVLRKPSRPEYKQWRAQSHDDAAKADSQEVLVRKLIVWPELDPAGLEALLDDWPGIPEACGNALLDLTGAAGKADAK